MEGELSDTILKWNNPRTIPAKFGLIWFRGVIGEVRFKSDILSNYA
jgi:hypothetical protein